MTNTLNIDELAGNEEELYLADIIVRPENGPCLLISQVHKNAEALYQKVQPKVIGNENYNKFIAHVRALMSRCNEVHESIENNSNNGNLVSGLMAEQEQILEELENYLLKTQSSINAAQRQK